MAMIEDDEVIQVFIEESKEHLEGIESDMLDIESGGKDVDSDMVNKVFRAIHSIKGGSSFLGLDTIKNLSHVMENLLNLIRNLELVPTSPVISTLLSASDKLRELVNNYAESNDTDISEELVALKGAVSASLPEQADESEREQETDQKTEPELKSEQPKKSGDADVELTLPDGKTIFTITQTDISEGKKGGRHMYLAKYNFHEDIEAGGKSLKEILDDIKATGGIIKCNFDDTAIKEIKDTPEDKDSPLYLFLATLLAPDMIGALIKIDQSNIFVFTDEQILEPLAGAPVEKTTVKKPSPKGQKKKIKEKVKVEKPNAEMKSDKKSEVAEKKEIRKPTQVKKTSEPTISTKSTSLRVNVKVLDALMILAGELVLTRNQLMQTFSKNDIASQENAIQRVDLVTSELQEAIMSTRMQPIGNVFNKFQRVVRDLSQNLGKEIQLIIKGEGVDLDKTIIEAIGDPLTHLVRNSADHGIEIPEERKKLKKPAQATIKLSAFHEAGQVIIEIADDGAGIDPQKVKEKSLKSGILDEAQLENMTDDEIIRQIFQPGFSMAKKVTDVSGRGVGMDVVNSNLTKIGGSIEINSKVNFGTKIRIKLPLTLAIIPSLITDLQGERYAIPQVSLVELVRIQASQIKKRIETIDGAAVIRLRGDLLPLIRLSDILKIDRVYFDKDAEKRKPERRANLEDRRSKKNTLENDNVESEETIEKRDQNDERRLDITSAYNIVVVDAGELNYGLLVDNLLDTEEIVVKPLGKHLRNLNNYAGATILGDGRAALILDIMGMSRKANLKVVKDKSKEVILKEKVEKIQDAQSLLIVKNGTKDQFAIPLGLVARIERIKKSEIETTGGRMAIKYRGTNLALFSIEEVANVSQREDMDRPFVIIFQFAGREVGVLVSKIVDVVDSSVTIDEDTFKQPGILGSAIILDQITLMLDLYGIVATINPGWVEQQKQIKERSKDGGETILIVEDSTFFLNQIKAFISDMGYNVITAMDGLEGIDELNKPDNEIDLVLTDIEMPNLDGVELTEKIRKEYNLNDLPVLALTSVAGDAAEKRALDAGIDEYLIKLDREKVLDRVRYYLDNGRKK